MAKFKSRVLLDFLELKVSDKVAKGKELIAGITSQSAKLTNLPYTVVQLTYANNDLEKKAVTASGGDRTAIQQRNTSEKNWNLLFKSVANYVSYVANGDVLLITSCGFNASVEESKAAKETVALADFHGTAIVNSPGALELSSTAQKNAKGYLKIVAPTSVGIEQQGDVLIISVNDQKIFLSVDTHSKNVINGLPSGTELSLFGAAFNAVGVGQLTQAKNVKAL